MENFVDLKDKTVFVTGATGFLATHCIKHLLQKDCNIVGSVRSLKSNLNKELKNIIPEKKQRIKLVEADLLDSECWKEAMKGCDFLLHIASPVFMIPPKDKTKVLRAAIEGTRNVLESAILNKIKKVVVMSSIMASYIKKKKNHFYTSEDYSEKNYYKYLLYAESKTLAEKEAWRISEKYKGKLNLTVLRPGLIIDETLTSRESFGNNTLIKMAFNYHFAFDMTFSIVSAFDVAKTCIKCLELPEVSRNKKYFLVENSYYISDVTNILKEEFEKFGYWFYRIYFPNFFIFIGSKFFDVFGFFYHKLKQIDIFETDSVKKDLKMGFENHREIIIRSTYRMIRNNQLRNKLK